MGVSIEHDTRLSHSGVNCQKYEELSVCVIYNNFVTKTGQMMQTRSFTTFTTSHIQGIMMFNAFLKYMVMVCCCKALLISMVTINWIAPR